MDTPMLLFTAGINGAMALVLWLLVKRPLYRVDRLEGEVKDLRDHKLATLDAQARTAALSRKGIHENLTNIRTHFVHEADCKARHTQQLQQDNEFRASVLKLERVSERTDAALMRGGQLLEQIIGMKADIAGICSKVEDLRNGK